MTSLVYVFINISTQNNFHPAKNSIAFNFFSHKEKNKIKLFTFYAFINDAKERDVFTLDGINPPDGDVTVAATAALLG